MNRPALVRRLLAVGEPCIRLWILSGICGHPATAPELRDAADDVRHTTRVSALLSERLADGTLPYHPCLAKWYGAHWVLVALVDRLLDG